MVDGLWIVQFHGPHGTGGGVAVLVKGKILGGDSGFTYHGTYDINQNSLSAKVKVQNFDSSVGNVLGVPGDFDLLIEGTFRGDDFSGTGALASAPDSKIVVRLRKSVALQ